MRKFLGSMFERLAAWLNKNSSQQEYFKEENGLQPSVLGKVQAVVNESHPHETFEKPGRSIQKKKTAVINYPKQPLRDVIDLMEFPFVALSKDRTNPIIYESSDKTKKVIISGHRGHFLASIYDWDIILVVAGKIQEILNSGSDIPSHKVTIPRHELLKALNKRQIGKKQQKDLEKSLARLKLTGIETTINNEDYKHKAGFGFIDSWGYTERKNDREMRKIQITLSPWLYELCCAQGALLKPSIEYFDIKSGIKRFLYRTARKHAGEDGWKFSFETLYEKSGSEDNIRKFKSKIKAVVQKNDLPDYLMEWIDRNGKIFIDFKKRPKVEELNKIVEKNMESIGESIEFRETGTVP